MSKSGGGTIESKAFDAAKLGAWVSKLPSRIPAVTYINDAVVFSHLTSLIGPFLFTTRRILPLIAKALVGQRLTSIERGWAAQPLYINLRKGRGMFASKQVSQNWFRGRPMGEAIGAEAKTSKGLVTTAATRGVILAIRGFTHN